MTTRSTLKTEHNGAKNGGGYYGRRVEAKAESRHRRRHNDKIEIKIGIIEADQPTMPTEDDQATELRQAEKI